MSSPVAGGAAVSAEKRQFVIKSCLGRGGYGEVYRASMTNANGLETDVAVKVLHPDLDRDHQAVQRLRDEGRMLGALVHAAILRVYDLVILEGRISLVTEYVEGQDLAKCIRGDSPMPPRAVCAVVSRVADALRAAWETVSPATDQPLQLIHRDIKPQNIRIGTQGDVKLLDFGVARSSQVNREAQTNTGHMVGSYLYMAPECLLENAFGRESDIFALGATMYESLAHERLFQDVSLRELYVLVLQEEEYAAWIRARLEALDAPAPVIALVRRMLARSPAERPTAAEVAAACDDLVDTLDGPTLRRWCKERVWPDADAMVGLLDGRTITEATMAASLRPDFAVTRPARAGRRVDWGLVFGTVGTLGLLVGLALGVVGLGVAVSAVLMRPDPVAVRVRPPEPGLIEAIDGSQYANPVRAERAVGPPQPAPGEVMLSELRFSSPSPAVRMRLRRNADTWPNGARVPLGTYGLEVDWRGGGFERVTEVRVRSGTTRVECNHLTRTCEVK